MANASPTSVKTQNKEYVCENLYSGDNGKAENIRILLFKECPLSDRELIFDSHLPNYAPNTSISNNNNKTSQEEFNHLTELIFGSAAMKYHNTYYKIHDAATPDQIIFTQVFSSTKKLRSNTTFSKSNTKFSTNSSLQSSSSLASSSSLNSNSNSFSLILRNNLTSTTIDSGFSSSSSLSRSCGSFARRESSFNSLGSFMSDFESTKSFAGNLNCTKLGLALILQKSTQNPIPQKLYVQSIPVIESILWRVRQYVEIALNSPRLFLSTMLEISVLSAKWLSKELIFWTKTDTTTKEQSYCMSIVSIFRNRFPRYFVFKREERDEKLDRFCKTVEELETKETKFFLGTLLTAVLTHHTGWIATCYPLENVSLNDSYHAVWNQLTNLFGATGYLTKSSKTVIYGLKNDTVKKVVDFIQYFIRYLKVERRCIERSHITEENKMVDEICERSLQKITSTLGDFNTENNLRELIGPNVKKKGLTKSRAINNDLFQLGALNEDTDSVYDNSNDKPVLFILGDHEKLQNLKNPSNPSTYNFSEGRQEESTKLNIIKFPLPKFKYLDETIEIIPSSFLPDHDNLDTIIPDKIYQGTNVPKKHWTDIMLNDLSLKKSCLFPGDIDENVVILGDTDNWDVQVWSSLRKRMIKNEADSRADSSPLVANMLDVLLQMWKMNMSKEQCTTFMEQKLIEICLRANALTQFLLNTDFCSMDTLLKTLHLNVVDIPLLMSVGSHINPQILQKYGLSYQ